MVNFVIFNLKVKLFCFCVRSGTKFIKVKVEKYFINKFNGNEIVTIFV